MERSVSTPTTLAAQALAVGAAATVITVAVSASMLCGRRVGFAIVGAAVVVFVARRAYLRWSAA